MKPLDTLPTEPRRIEDDDLRQLFLDGRTHNGWLDKAVPDTVLREIYDIVKFGPTSMNTQPMRLLFLRTAAAKQRLRPHLAPGNVDKTMTAPVTAIVGHDLAFHEHLPRLFPHQPSAKGMFEGKSPLIEMTAFRNGSLQGAYLIIAARALGLDCGPMSGFDNAGVDVEFFAGPHSSPISCATSAMAIIRKFSLARHALILLLFAHFFDRPQWMHGGPS
jgi:3-hydroxypropanoate dehydrogenase